MKKAIVFVAMAALLSGVSGAWAQEQKAPKALDVGQSAIDIGNCRYHFVSVRDNNTFRHDFNQSIVVQTGGQEYYKTDDGKTRVRVPEQKVVATASASSQGMVKGMAVGFVQGAASNAGPWFPLIPKFNNTNNNNGGNNSQSQGQGQRQRQGQGQLQGQQQGQAVVNTNTNLNTNVNTNAPVANAIQTQGQGQATGPFSPVTVLP